MSKFVFRFVGQATSIITDGTINVIVDPFFLGKFSYDGYMQTTNRESREKIDNIENIDFILLTHIHGDHYEVSSVKYFVNKYNSIIYAPADVVEDALKQGIPAGNLHKIVENMKISMGSLAVTCITGYDSSLDSNGRYNKYSFLFECNQKKLFYSGDCQHINDIQEDIGKVDYVAGWARDLPVSEAISKMHPDNYIIFHYDFPNPDDCKCNLDCRAEKERLGTIYKQVRFIIPEDSDRIIIFD